MTGWACVAANTGGSSRLRYGGVGEAKINEMRENENQAVENLSGRSAWRRKTYRRRGKLKMKLAINEAILGASADAEAKKKK
jgi:hypothetical protein